MWYEFNDLPATNAAISGYTAHPGVGLWYGLIKSHEFERLFWVAHPQWNSESKSSQKFIFQKKNTSSSLIVVYYNLTGQFLCIVGEKVMSKPN